MKNNTAVTTYTLDQIKEEVIGPVGEVDRNSYEFELKNGIVGRDDPKGSPKKKVDTGATRIVSRGSESPDF